MTIAENIARIRANMAAAAREAGRDPKEILLVGASKMNDAAACREAVAAGIDALGENRVQEMVQKLEQHAYDGAPLHFIGHLQRNKVKQVVGHVALIQSVGSLELLDEIEKVAAARGLVQDILLEVNIGREAAKSGFAPEKVLPAAEAALERTHVRVRGLMTIPPADAQRDANFRYFQEVQALYVDMNQKLFHNELEYLSMGMSGDYEDAIRAGATMVRVGSAIFVNIHATTQLKVVLVKPERFENASEIADHLKDKRTVVLNLESTNKDIARRLIDFLSGVAYAGEGKIKKVAANTYIITPYHVDIEGDLIDELENNGLYF